MDSRTRRHVASRAALGLGRSQPAAVSAYTSAATAASGESADGAGPIRVALSIKVPMIRPTIFVALIFTVIGSLQLFTEPLVLSSFTNAVTSTWTPSLYVYEAAFISNDYGRAAAASLLLAVACAVLSALVMRLSARRSR